MLNLELITNEMSKYEDYIKKKPHLQSQFITFHQNPYRVSHEFVCHLQNLMR